MLKEQCNQPTHQSILPGLLETKGCEAANENVQVGMGIEAGPKYIELLMKADALTILDVELQMQMAVVEEMFEKVDLSSG
jgi:hypothetical protein